MRPGWAAHAHILAGISILDPACLSVHPAVLRGIRELIDETVYQARAYPRDR